MSAEESSRMQKTGLVFANLRHLCGRRDMRLSIEVRV